MTQMTLTRKQVQALHDFAEKHGKDQWFLAKDHGAYIGMTAGSKEEDNFENILFYFKGCNPEKDEDFYDNAGYKFGWDDFGEHFSTEIFSKFLTDENAVKIVIKVGARQISMQSYALKPKAAA